VKLHIESVFPASPSTVWDTFNDPVFEKRLEEQSGIQYKMLSEATENGIEVRKLQCIAKKELPKVIAKTLGADRLSYTQVNRLDRSKDRLEWEVIPMAMADKVVAKGITTMVFKDGRSYRVVNGEITVKIPLVGGAIEKAIVSEVETSFVKAAEVALKLMQERAQS